MGAEEDWKHWSRFAAEWTTWARAPNHDAFWAYRASLAAFIGGGDGEALDVGCGEGRVSRELMALGYKVTATDRVSTLVECAAQAKSAHDYAVAGATRLPFEDGHFDLVVAYNVLIGHRRCSSSGPGNRAGHASDRAPCHFSCTSDDGSRSLLQRGGGRALCPSGCLLRQATLRRCGRA
jgi:SAM-dependent methyltransferase